MLFVNFLTIFNFSFEQLPIAIIPILLQICRVAYPTPEAAAYIRQLSPYLILANRIYKNAVK